MVSRRQRTKCHKPKQRVAAAAAIELPRILSLFCGAGGLDWGFSSVGFAISLAMDVSEAAVRTHNRNFPDSRATVGDLGTVTDAEFLAFVSGGLKPGSALGLIGGPPCQGFSRANRSTISGDPRNSLPARYLHFVGLLQRAYQVEFVVFENVPGMRDKKHSGTYEAFLTSLRALGFQTSEHILCASDFGVAQVRRRVVVIGVATGAKVSLEIDRALDAKRATVRDAIEGLPDPVFYSRDITAQDIPFHENHWAMRPRSRRFTQEGQLSTVGRSFKLLQWDRPSPTIAFGHREVYVHPSGQRRLSIYEAMQLQGFPTSFVLEGNLSEQVEQVSNAVPPPMARGIAAGLMKALKVGYG